MPRRPGLSPTVLSRHSEHPTVASRRLEFCARPESRRQWRELPTPCRCAASRPAPSPHRHRLSVSPALAPRRRGPPVRWHSSVDRTILSFLYVIRPTSTYARRCRTAPSTERCLRQTRTLLLASRR